MKTSVLLIVLGLALIGFGFYRMHKWRNDWVRVSLPVTVYRGQTIRVVPNTFKDETDIYVLRKDAPAGFLWGIYGDGDPKPAPAQRNVDEAAAPGVKVP